MLIWCFNTDITHAGLGGSFTDCFGVEEIVLVAGDKGAHILRGDQLNLITETGEFARQPVLAAAGFHHDATGGMLGEEGDQTGVGELALEDGFAMGIVSDEMKRALTC